MTPNQWRWIPIFSPQKMVGICILYRYKHLKTWKVLYAHGSSRSSTEPLVHIFLHCIFGNEAPYMYLASFLAHAADPSQGLSFVGHSRAQRLCIHRMNEDHMVGGSEICPGSRMLQRQKQYKGLLAQTKHHGHSMHKNSILRQVYIYIHCVCACLYMYKSHMFTCSKSLFFPWVLVSNGDQCFSRSRNVLLPKCSWSPRPPQLHISPKETLRMVQKPSQQWIGKVYCSSPPKNLIILVATVHGNQKKFPPSPPPCSTVFQRD